MWAEVGGGARIHHPTFALALLLKESHYPSSSEQRDCFNVPLQQAQLSSWLAGWGCAEALGGLTSLREQRNPRKVWGLSQDAPHKGGRGAWAAVVSCTERALKSPHSILIPGPDPWLRCHSYSKSLSPSCPIPGLPRPQSPTQIVPPARCFP